MRSLSLIVALLFTWPAFGQLKLPAEVRIPPSGKLARIQAETEAEKVTWKFPAGVDAVANGKLLICVAPAGRYTITCAACVDGDVLIADCVLIVEGSVPVPPPPPDDALVGKLQAAFAGDTGNAPEKARWLADLRGIYAAMDSFIDRQPTNAILADLVKDYTAAVLIVLPDKGILAKLRRAIADELATTLGTDGDAKLDEATKAKAKALFARINKALEGVK